jgi:hypothetical protein
VGFGLEQVKVVPFLGTVFLLTRSSSSDVPSEKQLVGPIAVQKKIAYMGIFRDGVSFPLRGTQPRA